MDVSIREKIESPEFTPTPAVNAISSRLRVAHLFVSYLHLPSFQLSWANLVNLNISDPFEHLQDGALAWQDIFNILLLAPRLELLACRAYHGTVTSTSPLTAHSLTQLVVRGGPGFTSLLESITLPALQALAIYPQVLVASVHGEPEWPGGAISGLVQRSGCTLTELHLDGFAAEPPNVLSVLAPLVHLKVLFLASLDYRRSLFSSLILDEMAALHNGKFRWSPGLEDLTIAAFDGALFGQLADVVVRRSRADDHAQPGSGSLRNVRLYWTMLSRERLDEAKLSELVGLRSAGMSVKLAYGPAA